MSDQDHNPEASGFVRDRLPDGTFGPKNSIAASGGRKGGRVTAAKDEWRLMFEKVAREVVTEDKMRALVETMLTAAIAGDLDAAHELLDRLLGKPTIAIDATIESTGKPTDPEAIEMLQKIARRHLKRLEAEGGQDQ